jgi:curved DNA-binding protein
MTHYSTLGVSENASQDEIKQAYRRLANKHHPDKGGDQATFKNISTAYDVIGDAQKRADYDNQRRFDHMGGFGGGGFHAHFQHGGFDIFGNNSPFGEFFRGTQHRVYKNRDLNITCAISLADSFVGKHFEAKYTLPSGNESSVFIDVPAGVANGDTIKYNGLGDDSIPNIPRGDLNITIVVQPDEKFDRRGNDVYTYVEINPIEAIIGCSKQVQTITGGFTKVDIRPGVESGVEFAKTGGGFRNIHTQMVGRFVTVVKIKTPIVNDRELLYQLSILNDRLNSL